MNKTEGKNLRVVLYEGSGSAPFVDEDRFRALSTLLDNGFEVTRPATGGAVTESGPDRRATGRIKTRFETLYSVGRTEGTATLSNISHSGAHFTAVSHKPDIGKSLRIFILLKPVAPFELIGKVVRHTEDGFAIEYQAHDEELRRFVDNAAAIVKVEDRAN